MKWPAGIVALIAFTLLGNYFLGWARGPAPAEDRGIRVVAGPDHRMVTPMVPERGAPPVAAAISPIAPAKEAVGKTPTDAEALVALFNEQARDPSWAPGAEAEIRSHLPAGSGVQCAEFLCHVAVPVSIRPMMASADQEAIAVIGHFAELSYNRFTATIGGDRQNTVLSFYVTKSAKDGEVITPD